MNSRNALSLLTVPVLLALTGCTVGPNYTPPVTKAPEQWSEPLDSGITTAASPASAWWTTFNDPTLTSLITRAVAANHDLRLAEARVREVQAQRGVVASQFGPAVDAAGDANRSRRSENTAQGGQFGQPESNDFRGGFDMTWELDFWGRIRRSVESAEADIAAAVGDRDAALVTLLGEVGRNYAELRGFQARKQVTIKNIGVQQSALELTQKRFDAGLTTELDVQQASTQLSQTKATLPPLDNGVRRAIHRLGVLLGQSPGALSQELSPDGPMLVATGEIPVGLPSDLLRRRPDIAAAERRIAAANAQIGVATADLFPKFNLGGSLGLQSDRIGDFGDAASRFWSIGPGFRWPILDWGRIRSNIRVQDSRTEQALIQFERTVLTSFEEVDNALVDLTSERDRTASLRAAVESSRRAVALAEQQYTSGLRDFLNVLTTQQSQFLAEVQLVESEQRVSTSAIALYKALGGGWDVNFTGPVADAADAATGDTPRKP